LTFSSHSLIINTAMQNEMENKDLRMTR